jgi:hypothetical protein
MAASITAEFASIGHNGFHKVDQSFFGHCPKKSFLGSPQQLSNYFLV